MVKKLKYLIFLIPFFTFLNVNATVIQPTTVYATFDDDTVISSNYYVSSDGNYFASNTLLGGVSSSQWIKAINFYYSNTNLCPNKQMTISGKVRLTNSFFQNQDYSLFINNNNSSMSCSTNLSTTYQQTDTLNFTCVGAGGGSFSVYFQQNNYTTPRQYDVLISRDLQYSCDVTNTDIINSQNQNTQNIINNNTQNSQNIINNQNSNTNQIIQDNQQNTQDIIDNQNSNTQQEIESQYVCKSSTQYSLIPSTTLNSNGTTSSSSTSSLAVSDFIKVPELIKITGSTTNANRRICFYTTDKTFISCSSTSNLPIDTIISIPANSSYFRYNATITNSLPNFSLCYNGNQALTDSITSEDTPNTNQDINDMNNMVASDTPISDLITMPLTLVHAYINGVNSSCSPVNLGNLYGTNLILPCINLEQRLGSNLWHIIDAFFSIFMCYNIGMLFITAFDGLTSLRDDFESLYQPKHADTGYQPKHGG